MRLASKGMNDTIRPERLVPSLLVFVVILSLPVINKPLPTQTERVAAMPLARSEVGTVTAELRISMAIQFKLPHATHLDFVPGGYVRVYKEKDSRWCGPFRIIRVRNKEVTVTYGKSTRTYGIAQAIRYKSTVYDSEL